MFPKTCNYINFVSVSNNVNDTTSKSARIDMNIEKKQATTV